MIGLSGAAAGLAQVNVRVDRHAKERAEQSLRLVGMSLPRVIKNVVEKIAMGGRSCEEVLAALDTEPCAEETVGESPFAASWASADQLYRDLGISGDPVSGERDWDVVYSEAMDAHYRGKGLIS